MIGTADTKWQVTAVLVAVGAFVIGAALWWSYFDVASRVARGSMLLSLRSGTFARNLFSWGHFPIAVSLTLLGVGAELAIRDSTGGTLEPAARWALCGGIALYLLAISMLVGALARSLRAICRPCLPAVPVAMGLAAFGGSLPAVRVVAALAALLVLQVLLQIALAAQAEQTIVGLASTEPRTA